MCDVLDKVENKGKAEGKIEGKNQMALLVKKLLDQSRIEDVKRASENEASSSCGSKRNLKLNGFCYF